MYARGNDGLRRKRRRSGWGVTGRNRSAISALPISVIVTGSCTASHSGA